MVEEQTRWASEQIDAAALVTSAADLHVRHIAHNRGTMFEVAEAYEVMMGRWSRQLAPLFIEFAGVRDGEKVLDVGCGTGALSETLTKVTNASKIIGIDPSNGFIEYARTHITDPRVTFEVGEAETLPFGFFWV